MWIQLSLIHIYDEKLMFKIIRASFNQRRKTLANGLNNFGGMGLTKEQIQQSIEAVSYTHLDVYKRQVKQTCYEHIHDIADGERDFRF